MGRRDPYRDRAEAGEVLADAVLLACGTRPAIVLALPRGGVPVAVPVARRLAAPLGLMLVRKLGVPGRPELAMGALAQIGRTPVLVRHDQVIEEAGVDDESFERVKRREEEILTEKSARYGAAPLTPDGRSIVLVDDGLATGMTALAAVAAARALHPPEIVMAAPVGSAQAVALLEDAADLVVCPLTPHGFSAVSLWYRTFDQLSDAEVIDALTAARHVPGPVTPDDHTDESGLS